MPVEIEVRGTIVPDGDKWIYDYFEQPCTTAADIRNKIRSANGDVLEVSVNSPGGDIFVASEIYTALKDYNNVKIKVTGLAASAASVIAMAGYCEMSPTAQMMVHNVWTRQSGDYRDMDSASDSLKKANRSIANAYCVKSGMSMEAALKLMDETTWMTAHDARALGLVDKVLFNVDDEEGFYQNQLFNSVLKENAKAMYAAIPRLSPSVIAKMRESRGNAPEKNENQENKLKALVDQNLESAKAYLNYLKLKGDVKND
ncbi:head maturation protease, ClpP-related [Acetobacterium woodii]|uniref:ATP-dependent Clp protease proteolytic subunit n=1 Tax=Acetobacterium woodii (strain ATCC 29683 / DSM 1030 / JCM 2381 / KCTC 1655 / WB1) TaxID=931626 RepID=H6LCB9_ACEWD|nr:head maturation protease, ClpP-related [Acetobacterium woodii]AFA49832.1 putative Clp protease, phage associated [Acetobacterium woodii DSM 1030]AFA50234.1 ATP-dependent Clp protease proteolytic subunit [Acetobacterium woodii DSM 1030]